MKIGVFDSGLGGLIIAKAMRDALPHHDMVYLGDTLHVPYGSRSQEAVLKYTKESIDFLFSQSDCKLIVMACNTASALTLRKLQQGYLRDTYPDRRILGVVVPTLETALDKKYKRIGLLATERIIESEIYKMELEKLDKDIKLFQVAAPLLVPAIELQASKWIEPLMEDYIAPLMAKDIECLILGCTHYSYLKSEIKKRAGSQIDILSQDEIIPAKLKDYLERHPEIDEEITKTGHTDFYVTDVTQAYIKNAQEIYHPDINVRKVHTGS